jgi:hypothetical protein
MLDKRNLDFDTVFTAMGRRIGVCPQINDFRRERLIDLYLSQRCLPRPLS